MSAALKSPCPNLLSEVEASDMAAGAKCKRVKAKHIGAKKAKGWYRPPGVRFDWKLGRNVKEAT